MLARLLATAAVGGVVGFIVFHPREAEATGPTATVDADEAQRWLLGGNAWFVKGGRHVGDTSVERRTAVAPSQAPSCTILTCADSRVPPEHLFHAGLGDMFTVRVAGNVAEPVTTGSIEYAVEHLGTQLVVVMGHERCGAVKAALSDASLGPNLDALLALIRPGIGEIEDLDEAVRANVHAQVAGLRRSAILHHAEAEGTLTLLAAYYDLDTGVVTFLDSPPTSAVAEAAASPRTPAEGHAPTH
ncbi:carbonic anhydrase [Deltaproteobacteria bacterium]|nr:carbonic anhydrase [Deltaproteobacteria bacterium]